MSKNKSINILDEILLQIQWQRLVPRSRQPKKVCPENIKNEHSDPIFSDYRDGKITRSGICKYLGIHKKELLMTLVEKGELFGD